eukprot:CAMPEP_0185037660 /NCGR_PEP_ID=MMETSP1103-20130426/32388_1 /TAXON_ID=36769 /ORGANISM="Paraphysomonas bandaiensis, Strain Caron Lab Isolate" /LENGTH=723 /DNA_ID=CAMNT_0027575741 /DNA_START=151 /DNA_END=2322 /DNA_ORIENTATION=-
MNDIRRLKTQLCEGNRRRQNNEFDSHVIAGVLISALKDMNLPLLHELFDDILEIDINDDSDENINGIARNFAKLPAQRIEISRMLFSFIYRLARTHGNDANIAQLIMIISPVIYRPVDTSYMSIRHAEALKQARPVLQFIVEQHADIMKCVGPSKYQPPAPRNHVTTRDVHTTHHSTHKSPALDPNKLDFMSQLQLSIPRAHSDSVSSTSSTSSHGSVGTVPTSVAMEVEPEDISTHSPSHTHSPNYNSWEWKVLEALVTSRIDVWLNRSGNWEEDSGVRYGFGSGTTGSSSLTPVVPIQPNLGSRAMDDLRLGDSDEDEHDIDSNKTNRGPRNTDKHHKMMAPVEHRTNGEIRKCLIVECKLLRQEIQNFEEKWIQEHKRPPASHEKGHMHGTYSRYKELKRLIRDQAGKDIQRVFRGFRARERCKKLLNPSDISKQDLSENNSDDCGEPMDTEHKRPVSAGGQPHSNVKPVGMMMNCDQKSANSWFISESDNVMDSDSHSAGSKHKTGGADIGVSISQAQQRYRECMEMKRQLKRNLKKFDDDFFARKGRVPRKADKEVMRPQYQKYHEVRAELERLKEEIIGALGHFPSELEDGRGGTLSSAPSPSGWAEHFSRESSIDTMSEDDDMGSGNGMMMSSDAEQDQPRSNGANSTPATAPAKGVDALINEKKQLHAYLKTFEKEFNRVNGRHVMHPEDIKPVAEEYQRYKELKKILKDLRNTL